MKKISFIILLSVCILGAQTTFAADVTEHNFQYMYYTAGTMTVTNTNKTGITDFCTYTCSGTKAKFYADYNTTGSTDLCVFFENSSDILVTTAIPDLDSLRIYYLPATAAKQIKVSYSTDSVSWTPATVGTEAGNGIRTVKFPQKGNYYLKFARSGLNFYIRQINYYTISCQCLRIGSL